MEITNFINECEAIENKINLLSFTIKLKDSKFLNINDRLKEVVGLIAKQNEKYNSLSISGEDKKRVDEAFNKIKTNCAALLNNHVVAYNTKVDYINARVEEFTTKFGFFKISDEVKEMIGKLEKVSRCETFNNGDWRQLNYLEFLDYAKLDEEIKKISMIENKLNIKPMESVEIWASCKHIESNINELEEFITDDMSLRDISILLNKSNLFYEQIVDTDIRHQLSINESSDKEITTSYNNKIKELNKNLKELLSKLLDCKKNATKKPSCYKTFSDELDMLEKKYEIMTRKMSEYKGKCNKSVIKHLNTSYLREYEEKLNEIQDNIKLSKDELDIIQKDNLNKRIHKISRKRDAIHFDLNISPIMLDGVDVGLEFENKMKQLDTKLEQLQGKISDSGKDKLRFIKDHEVIKDIEKGINSRRNDIDLYEKLLSNYKKESPEVYNALKPKLDEKKSKFDKVCKEYRGKRPLAVKAIKSAEHFHKKYKKEALIIAGLSTLVLLLGHNVIIPAIMHANIMIGAKSVAMRAHIKTVNNILGCMIGATKDVNGAWFLSNGIMINPSVASTSLLKGLAFSALGHASMASPLIASAFFGLKNLIGKMKSGELKKKMQESKDVRNQRKTEREKKKNEECIRRELEDEIKILYGKYVVARNEKGMALEDFVKQNKLSDKQASILIGMEQLELEMKNSNRRSRKGGN